LQTREISKRGASVLASQISRIEFPRFLRHSFLMVDDQLEGATCNIGIERKLTEPCSIVIFGASGDLTARKLIPALYHLCKDKLMPESFRVIGFARRDKTDESWRAELREALNQFSRTKPVDEKIWQAFAKNIFYCQGDLTDAAAYQKLE